MRRFDGDIAAGCAHGNAHICLRQGRRVINAIPNHDNPASLRLAALTPSLLTDALGRVCDPDTRSRADAVRERLIPAQDAVRRAADVVAAA